MRQRLLGLLATTGILVALLFAVACGGGGNGGYPDDFDSSFLASCYENSGGEAASCLCALDKVHDKYETYAELLANYDESELAILAADCIE